MTTAVTFRVPTNLIIEVSHLFNGETKTESFLKAIKKGVEYQKSLKEKMIADYSSITEEECECVKEAGSFAAEIIDDDFEEYSKFL